MWFENDDSVLIERDEVMVEPTNEQYQERCMKLAKLKYTWHLGVWKYYWWFEDEYGKEVRADIFTDSVDAHAKWTWTELDKRKYGYSLIRVGKLFVFPITESTSGVQIASGLDKEAALAICKAIWELTEINK